MPLLMIFGPLSMKWLEVLTTPEAKVTSAAGVAPMLASCSADLPRCGEDLWAAAFSATGSPATAPDAAPLGDGGGSDGSLGLHGVAECGHGLGGAVKAAAARAAAETGPGLDIRHFYLKSTLELFEPLIFRKSKVPKSKIC